MTWISPILLVCVHIVFVTTHCNIQRYFISLNGQYPGVPKKFMEFYLFFFSLQTCIEIRKYGILKGCFCRMDIDTALFVQSFAPIDKCIVTKRSCKSYRNLLSLKCWNTEHINFWGAIYFYASVNNNTIFVTSISVVYCRWAYVIKLWQWMVYTVLPALEICRHLCTL